MLPVSSATTCCSSQTMVPLLRGLRSSPPYWEIFGNNVVKSSKGVVHLYRASLTRQPASCFLSTYKSFDENGAESLRQVTLSRFQVDVIDDSQYLETNHTTFLDKYGYSPGDNQPGDFVDQKIEDLEILPNYAATTSATPSDGVPIGSPVSDSFNIETDSLSSQETNQVDIVSGAQDTMSNILDSISSSVKTTLGDANEAVDNAINEINSFINRSGESVGDKLTGLSGELKETSGRAGIAALDVLRGTIVVVEESLLQGAKGVVYSYSYVKKLLPPQFEGPLSSSEESVQKVLIPVGTAIQQVYAALEGFEESLGLDPKDPIIPFVLFLGISATFWGAYRVLKYSGYSGDLSPQSALELLQGKEKVVLVDIRPESLREKDGIPDLRRTARFRYVSVAPPELDGSVRKLLKGGKEVEDSLVAVVIRNLKITDDRSKVIVMDSNGTRSKGVARALRKLGVKRPYLVQGGFRSWVEDGFRIKVLKPETALTILNEEAEAILEEIKPTPLKLTGYGLVILASAYSLIGKNVGCVTSRCILQDILVEWERTLQFIGVLGLGQTMYRRFTSYQDAEDFKQDVSYLLAPIRLGVEAISGAIGKLETNGNGLQTSPLSSSDVQIRVLQAAAKHESQPEEAQDSSQVPSSSNDNVNISEA